MIKVNLLRRSAFCALALAVLLNVACGAKKTPATAPTSAVAAPEAIESDSPAATAATADNGFDAVDEEVDLIIARAQGEFDLGLEILHAGDSEQAREHFDHAVEAFIQAGIPIHSNKRLHATFDRILDDIAALEAQIQEPEAEFERVAPPTEGLGDMLPEIPPERAEAERKIVEPEIKEVTFDIPMVVNDKVLAWVDTFQNNQAFRKSFIGGYQRYGWFQPMIHRILEEEGLPKDLIYLAFLESTYKTNAYSRARAKGVWQFMTSTGRQYGLKVNRYIDERSHPEKATRAAARYLKDLYETFNDWHLAMAGYNTGAGNIMRAQRRSRKDDYWSLASSRYMYRETKNFVPAILAIALIAKEPEKYGFEGLKHNDPLQYDKVSVDGPARVSLIAALTGTSEKEIRFLNPQLRRGVTPPGYKSYDVLVPKGTGSTFQVAYAALPRSEKIAKLDTIHTVRRGETLATISRKYGVSVNELARMNGIRNPNRIKIGMKLNVPKEGGYSARVVQAQSGGKYHVVRRGDTLSGIADAYGIGLSQVFRWNGMSKRTVLRPGMKVLVSSSGSRVTTASRNTPSRSASSSGVHVVRRGDTLYGISRDYGVNIKKVYAWNGMSKRTVLKPGMRVIVAEPGSTPTRTASAAAATVTYRVRRGDNLYRIARRYGTTVDDLRSWNNISGDSIRAGETLTIHTN